MLGALNAAKKGEAVFEADLFDGSKAAKDFATRLYPKNKRSGLPQNIPLRKQIL